MSANDPINFGVSTPISKGRFTINTAETTIDLTAGGTLKAGRRVMISFDAAGSYSFSVGFGAAPAATLTSPSTQDGSGMAFRVNAGDEITFICEEGRLMTHIKGFKISSAGDINVTVFDK